MDWVDLNGVALILSRENNLINISILIMIGALMLIGAFGAVATK